MNKLNKVLLMLILLLSFSYVKADCSEEELTKLKEDADKIEITYKHLGEIKGDEGSDYNRFDIKVNNLPKNSYVMLEGLNDKYETKDNQKTIEIKNLSSGKWKINVYSKGCNEIVNYIDFKLPKFNMLSLDPLCEGVDGEDFELCGKYYDYNISYEDFKQRVERYRYINKIGVQDDVNKNNKYNILNLISEKIKIDYIIIALTAIIIFATVICLIKKKRNKGVLK